MDLRPLVKCRKPDCWRKVPQSVAHCCGPCADAANGQYEIERHSAGCDQRALERGECKDLMEAELLSRGV